MSQALSIEIYQLLEEKIGREEAKKVASAIELGFDVIEKKAEAVALQKKLELKDELTKELATKADLQLLNQKFNFMIVLLIIALTLMNPVVAEIIQNLLK